MTTMTTTPYEPGYHSVQPGQKCRILTVQIAVPFDADPSAVADEISGMLTGSIENPESCILDWGYWPGRRPEDGNFAVASEQPVENEIFEPERRQSGDRRIDALATCYIARLPQRYPALNFDPDYIKSWVSAHRPRDPHRKYQTLTVHPAEEYWLLTDTGYGPSIEGPFPTQDARDEFVRREIASGDLNFPEDDIFYLDFENGKPVHAWMPDEDPNEDED